MNIPAPYASAFRDMEDAQIEADNQYERENEMIGEYLASDENSDFVCAVGRRLDCSYLLRDLVAIVMQTTDAQHTALRRSLETAIRDEAKAFIKASDNAARESWELRHV
jgi:hypothetical protein